MRSRGGAGSLNAFDAIPPTRTLPQLLTACPACSLPTAPAHRPPAPLRLQLETRTEGIFVMPKDRITIHSTYM